MRIVRRFPWAALLPLAALAVYAAPSGWHREWRLAAAGAWRQAGDFARGVAAPDAPAPEPGDSADDRAAALLAERGRMLDELAELRAIVESYEITRKAFPRLRLVSAGLVPADNADADLGILDRGARDGVAPGDAVVLGDALLGVVTRAGPSSSWMRYATAPSSRLSARAVPPEGTDARTAPRELCLVAGRGRHRAEARFYTFETPVDKGWLLVTASTPDNPLPDGILVGRVLERPGESGEAGVKIAPVELAASALRGLRVMVVKGG